MVNLDGVVAYRAEPTAPPIGGLIVIHEIWGLVDHIKDIADRYAAQGYVTIAPDLLSDAGLSPELGLELFQLSHDPDEGRRTQAQPIMREKLTATRSPEYAAEATAKLKKAVDALAADPRVRGRIAVLGFCFGGTYAFLLASADPRVRAAVPFYGSGPALEQLESIHCPVLAFYGEQDTRLMEALPDLRASMVDAGVPFTDVVYPNTGHAFFNNTNAHAYDQAAASDAWARSLDFLSQALAS